MGKERILNVLPRTIRDIFQRWHIDYKYLQEIRLRVNQEMRIIYKGREYSENMASDYLVSEQDIGELLEYVSEYSLYAYEQELRQGYITIEGGHRIGFTGKAIVEGGRVKNLKYISSVNIRLSHEILNCADKLFPYVVQEQGVYHTLIISPPRCGKTTILRDFIRQLSEGNEWVAGCNVGVVDERSELGGCFRGMPQNKLGPRTDILDACPKVEGMMMLVRSMSPQVIAVDEIGREEDVRALEQVICCGCKVIGSVHGSDLSELNENPAFERLMKSKIFQRYVVLTDVQNIGNIRGIYDGDGNVLCENHGEYFDDSVRNPMGSSLWDRHTKAVR